MYPLPSRIQDPSILQEGQGLSEAEEEPSIMKVPFPKGYCGSYIPLVRDTSKLYHA